ncbi:hypothetical protein, partial [Dickeya dianthicola]|uniref:hypothetical protein n=1 Tax=Dickeya dianthicola TaxID=204039 RepID=UPI001E42DDC9
FMQAELASGDSDSNMLSQIQSPSQNSGECSLRRFLLVDAGFVMSNHPWLKVYSLSCVFTIAG